MFANDGLTTIVPASGAGADAGDFAGGIFCGGVAVGALVTTGCSAVVPLIPPPPSLKGAVVGTVIFGIDVGTATRGAEAVGSGAVGPAAPAALPPA
jgi:hypothetical protein